jgi:hypothetical protein
MTPIQMDAEVERARQLLAAPRLDRIPVTANTFRRLPLRVRDWYLSRQRCGGPLLTELAARALINSFLALKTERGGPRSVDGYKARRQRPEEQTTGMANRGKAA